MHLACADEEHVVADGRTIDATATYACWKEDLAIWRMDDKELTSECADKDVVVGDYRCGFNLVHDMC
jgi:hypothetical protein